MTKRHLPHRTMPRASALLLALMLATGGMATAQADSDPAATDPAVHQGQPQMHGQHRGQPGRHAGQGMARMLDQIGATDAQKAQVAQITQAARAEGQASREAGMALREQMMQLMAQPAIDAAAVEALRQQMMAQHDVASQRRVQTMLDVAQVLTPQQRAQMAERMQARVERMKARRAAGERRAP